MESRKEKRLYGLKNLVILEGEREVPAIMVDISPTGICVRCDKTLPTYREVYLRLELNGRVVSLKAAVRWVNDPVHLKGTNLKEIGLSIIDPPEVYIRYLEMISDED